MEPLVSPRKPPLTTSELLPVDSDNKATKLRPFSISTPHMRAFHLAWLSLFSCFFSTFSIPPLLPIIRDDLQLSDADIGTAGIASFLGSIFSRLAMGPACDLVGPRIASATLSLLTAPVILATSFVTSANLFILVRFLVGFCLANFVANQFWMSSMFAENVVGLANGVSAGWANVGSGVAQLTMPLFYSIVTEYLNVPPSTAWRVIFFVPAVFQASMALMVLAYGQDLPSGNYSKNSLDNPNQTSFIEVLLNGLTNYRGWILALTYGFSFGVELTMENIVAEYFYDKFGVDIAVAGSIAAIVGMSNWFSRPIGGMISDHAARVFGMRGRLWALWTVQMMGGVLCVMLGRVYKSLWSSIVVMSLFAFFVQAASGLNFGVVPFVSKRSLGVISGLTGSGGTVGAVVTQLLLFSGSKFSKQTSISLMGLMMIVCTLPVSLIYFPQSGGMFCGPSFNSDPQDYRPLEQEEPVMPENK